MMRRLSVGLLSILSILLAACQSFVPEQIQRSIPGSPELSAVRSAVDTQYQGALVRWGGTIAKIENKTNETWLEVVDKPLSSQGRPLQVDQSAGRFIANVKGFLDPMIYKVDREITVVGRLGVPMTRQIGEQQYKFPVLDVQITYLWPLRRAYGGYPYWPGGFYDPYFGYPYRFYGPYRPFGRFGFFPYW